MKKLSFIVALFAAFAMVIVPVAPANAAISPEATQKARAELLRQAEAGNALILTQQQLKGLAKTNKSLHARLMKAYRANEVPVLSESETKELQKVTSENLSGFKAGLFPDAPGVAASGVSLAGLYAVFGLLGFIVALIFMSALNGQQPHMVRFLHNFGVAMLYPLFALIGFKLAFR